MKIHDEFQKKVAALENNLSVCISAEARYRFLIDLGQTLSPLDSKEKNAQNLVSGCQSELYLHTRLIENKLFFNAFSESFISAGLAAILIKIYSGETPETILKQPPDFLNRFGIASILSPNRSHGLTQIHLRMKQEALRYLLQMEND